MYIQTNCIVFIKRVKLLTNVLQICNSYFKMTHYQYNYEIFYKNHEFEEN